MQSIGYEYPEGESYRRIISDHSTIIHTWNRGGLCHCSQPYFGGRFCYFPKGLRLLYWTCLCQQHTFSEVWNSSQATVLNWRRCTTVPLMFQWQNTLPLLCFSPSNVHIWLQENSWDLQDDDYTYKNNHSSFHIVHAYVPLKFLYLRCKNRVYVGGWHWGLDSV